MPKTSLNMSMYLNTKQAQNSLNKSLANTRSAFNNATDFIHKWTGGLNRGTLAMQAFEGTIGKGIDSVWEYSKALEKIKTAMSTLVAVNSASITSTGQMLNAMQKFNLASDKSSKILEQFKKTSLETRYSVSDLGDMFRSFYSTASSKMSLDEAVKAFKSVSVATQACKIHFVLFLAEFIAGLC